MGMAAGLSLAYMKIVSLALGIMVLVWVAAKIWLAFYQKKNDPTGADDAE